MDEEQLSNIIQVSGFGTSGGTILTTTGNRYYAVGNPSPNAAKVIKIRLRTSAAGTVTFSVGLIDQFRYWLEVRTFIVSVISGLNDIAVNQNLLAGQQLAVKAPSPSLQIQATGAYWRSSADGYSQVLEKITGSSLAFEYDTRDLYEHAVAGRREFKSVKN